MKLKLKTQTGEVEVVATPVTADLYVHRSLNQLAGWWTISNARGWGVVDVRGTRQKAIGLAEKYLATLNWNIKKGIKKEHKEAVNRLLKETL